MGSTKAVARKMRKMRMLIKNTCTMEDDYQCWLLLVVSRRREKVSQMVLKVTILEKEFSNIRPQKRWKRKKKKWLFKIIHNWIGKIEGTELAWLKKMTYEENVGNVLVETGTIYVIRC